MNATETQVGGNHYTKLRMQPMEFTMKHKWDSCAHSVLKYVVRYRDKGGLADLKKALHCLHLRRSLRPPTGFWLLSWMYDRGWLENAAESFVCANSEHLTTRQQAVLLTLGRLVVTGEAEMYDECARKLQSLIDFEASFRVVDSAKAFATT
jgi:hypothetical protein